MKHILDILMTRHDCCAISRYSEYYPAVRCLKSYLALVSLLYLFREQIKLQLKRVQGESSSVPGYVGAEPQRDLLSATWDTSREHDPSPGGASLSVFALGYVY